MASRKGIPVSDRKYRQHGYQDGGEKSQPRSGGASGEKPARKDTFGPRPLQMPGKRNVSRCAQCGTVLPTAGEIPDNCPKCGFELHSCKQCTYFDPSKRFECMQPIPERIPRKDVRNACTFYAIRVTTEKETTTPVAAKPADARAAFDNLFKK
jgi:predicted RNA-binding Zn-ribbon protein involved in translation (DUF1610 family)